MYRRTVRLLITYLIGIHKYIHIRKSIYGHICISIPFIYPHIHSNNTHLSSPRWSLLSKYNVSFECIVLLCVLYYVSIHLFSYLVVHTIQSSLVEHQNLYHMTTSADCGSSSSTSSGRVCFDRVDIVYTWVNGSDEAWLSAKAAYSPAGASPQEHRFRDNNELRYSLRSIEKHAPWVGNIYIVTNGQVPRWLDVEHPKVFIVPHTAIFPDTGHLPTFSSSAIESHLHRIPGLSDKFIYFNDDVFLGAPVYLDDFITQSKGQRVYLAWAVPSCAPRCSDSWVHDGVCDQACNVSQCDFDGGDCLQQKADSLEPVQDEPDIVKAGHYADEDGPEDAEKDDEDNEADELLHPKMTDDAKEDEKEEEAKDSVGSGFSFEDPTNMWERRLCARGCNVGWIGDGTCDVACNVAACGFDGGDCAGFSAAVRNSSVVYRGIVDRSGADMKRLKVGDAVDEEVGVLHVNQTIDVTEHWPVLVLILDVSGIFGSHKVLEVFCGGKHTLRCLQMRNAKEMSGSVLVLVDYDEEAPLPEAVDVGVKGFSSLKATLGPVELRLHAVLWTKGYNRSKSVNMTKVKQLIADASSRGTGSADGGSWENTAGFDAGMFNEEAYGFGGVDGGPLGNETQEESTELDVFGKSIRFVNELMNEAYGVPEEPRSVIAHMPHLIDKRVMARVQAKWEAEFTATSSHRFRHEEDMQYAFTYFYYIMNEPRDIAFMELWVQLDSNEDGHLDANEIRTLTALITDSDGDHPLSKDDEIRVLQEIFNGDVSEDPKDWSISPRVLSNAAGIVQRLVHAISPGNVLGGVDKNFELESLEQVTFVMLQDNTSEALHRLDSIRKQHTKFVCINDDMNHSAVDPANAENLDLFYQSMFPLASSFELPPDKERTTPLFLKQMTKKGAKDNGRNSDVWSFHGYSIVFVSSMLAIPSAPFIAVIVYTTWKRRKNRRRAPSKGRGTRVV